MAPAHCAVAALVLCVYAGGLAVSDAFHLHALPLRQLPPRPRTCPLTWHMAASATGDKAAGNSHKFILLRTRALAKKNPEMKGNLIRILCNPTSEHYDKKVAEMWERFPKSERKIVLQKHEQQKLSWGSTLSTPAPVSLPPPQETAVYVPRTSESVSRTDAAKSRPGVADAYAQAQAEQDAIAQIKQRFMDKIENKGRQATMRLKTMGELGLAAYQDGAKKANNLPDEVYIPPPSPR